MDPHETISPESKQPSILHTNVRFSLRTFLLTHILVGAIATVVFVFFKNPEFNTYRGAFPAAVVGTMFVYVLFIIRLPWSYQQREDTHLQGYIEQSEHREAAGSDRTGIDAPVSKRIG